MALLMENEVGHPPQLWLVPIYTYAVDAAGSHRVFPCQCV